MTGDGAPGKVLHLLSQRPGLTGSGVTLDRLVHHAAAAGWRQRVIVGVPADAPEVSVGGLPAEHVRPLRFETDELPFPVPGMSDVMPYPSTVFSSMSERRWEQYRSAWRRHLERTRERFQPAVIHTHHVWVLSALVKDVFPRTPVVTHCHATGLRQMRLCPEATESVRTGVARNEVFLALHQGMVAQLRDELGVEERRIHVVGAGFRGDLFHRGQGSARTRADIAYVGKIAAAKGLDSLLDALERLWLRLPEVRLHVAGAGSGAEAQALSRRMEALGARVIRHGQLDQRQLAPLLRRCGVFVLPSFYEGLALVLVEAVACGCRIVATDLPAVREQIAPRLGDAIELVALPGMSAVDTPLRQDLPPFAERLEAALARALRRDDPVAAVKLDEFTWQAVFRRVERVWRGMI